MAGKVIPLATRRERLKKPRRRWKATPRIFLFLLGVIGLRMLGGFVVRHMDIIMLQNKITRVQREINAFEQRHEVIREQIEYMQGDEYVEKAARDKLGLVMPGDVVYKPTRPARPGDPLDVQKRPGKSGVASGGGY
mgnify:CR=1 FL=1